MREIKFRAWDGEEMLCDWLVLRESNQTIVPHTLSRKAMVVMQYTGLKDKNGKEIYEGDIVKGKMQTDGKTHYGEMLVEYEENSYDYGGRCIGFDINGFYQEFEVVGNIYENPELLNK